MQRLEIDGFASLMAGLLCHLPPSILGPAPLDLPVPAAWQAATLVEATPEVGAPTPRRSRRLAGAASSPLTIEQRAQARIAQQMEVLHSASEFGASTDLKMKEKFASPLSPHLVRRLARVTRAESSARIDLPDGELQQLLEDPA